MLFNLMRKLKRLSLFGFLIIIGYLILNNDTNVDLKESKLERVNACIFILCQEKDLKNLTEIIENFEHRFNSRHNYDYVIMSEQNFSRTFQTQIRKVTKSIVKFGLIPEEHWSYPEFIDQSKTRHEILMFERKTKMLFPESYHFMCRYYSGFFFRHKLVQNYEFYWRIDAGHTKFLCDISIDPFQVMKKKGFKYAFTMTTLEDPRTAPTLWQETLKFVNNNPDLKNLVKENNRKFILDSKNDYNYCMFNNNFEIASFSIYKDPRYLQYFEHLEKAGGFFYERWGDAPIRTIAVSLFLSKSEIFLFKNIGYKHYKTVNCPEVDRKVLNCSCNDSIYSHTCMNYWL